MSNLIKIKKGLDIHLLGDAELTIGHLEEPCCFALVPSEFHGVRPKLLVKDGDAVKAGSPIFFDKDNEKVMFCSPVSGTVKEVVRGEKRVILEIIIEKDGKEDYVEFPKKNPDALTREEIIDTLLVSGVWPLIRQRPWGRIAKATDLPKSIFISAFDTAPLAPDYEFIIKGNEALFQQGIDILKKLTKGKVYLNLREENGRKSIFSDNKGVEINYFKGPHPAGNVGVQIHHLDTLTKHDIIWYCGPQDVLTIARLFTEGRYNAEKIFCLTGSEVKDPQYFKGISGMNLEKLFTGYVADGHNRYISGNVLTGRKINKNGYLGYYDNQLTVIPEGDHYEFLGWIEPGFNKFSTSGAIASNWLSKNKKRRLDTNVHGGHRAYMMTGEYENVFPFDIYPNHLIKAILAEDIDRMEQLGIYEVIPEDIALCEVVCTSKSEVQEILQKGIDLMIQELG